MDILPRDLQLRVISRMDMDARIRTGIVFPLRVPPRVTRRLNMVLDWKLFSMWCSPDTYDLSTPWKVYMVSAGRCEDPGAWLEHWHSRELPLWFKMAGTSR